MTNTISLKKSWLEEVNLKEQSKSNQSRGDDFGISARISITINNLTVVVYSIMIAIY